MADLQLRNQSLHEKLRVTEELSSKISAERNEFEALYAVSVQQIQEMQKPLDDIEMLKKQILDYEIKLEETKVLFMKISYCF